MKPRRHLPELRQQGRRHRSYIRNEAEEESDIDILVEFKQDADIGLLKFVEIENYLSDLLGVKVDLVEKSALKPRIGRHILKEVVYI